MSGFRGIHPHYSEGQPPPVAVITPAMIAAGMAACADAGMTMDEATLRALFQAMFQAMYPEYS